MRVACLAFSAPPHNAIGNQLADKVRVFLDGGAQVRVFLENANSVHPELQPHAERVDRVAADGPAWTFLANADLVVVEYSQFFELLHFLPLLADERPRIVFDYHGVTPPELWQGPNREGLEKGLAHRGLAWFADFVIAHSEYARQELLKATGLPADRVGVVPFAVANVGRPRRSSRIQEEAKFALFVGRLASNKRVPVLIEAIARTAYHAVIVGDDGDVYSEEAARCRALAKELGCADRVRFLGQVDDAELVELYRSADCLVMPSLHEGFCFPVAEAQACGLPVIAARSTALPETLGPAGLSFEPDDVEGLVRQLHRVVRATTVRERVSPHRSLTVAAQTATERLRVAVVCFRFSEDIVGGAETSLRILARSLQAGGHRVEVLTTCNVDEANWSNRLPAGRSEAFGLPVERFPIDPHDRDAHLRSLIPIQDGSGRVTAEQEETYLRHSVHSTDLIASLRRRLDDLDAIIVGPYLFGLTAAVAREFPQKTLVLPCFHDEPLAKLSIWRDLYGRVGGLLFHTEEERHLANAKLAIHAPRNAIVGTVLEDRVVKPMPAERPYLVYCGRFSAQKNLPLLLEFAARYDAQHPGRFQWTFLGRGEVEIPSHPWVRFAGYVEEEAKLRTLAGASGLVQLSRNESLSLVALEAWMQRTPVIVHRDCPVLVGQVERSAGGLAISGYEEFAAALDELWQHPENWQSRGEAGRAYVEREYLSRERLSERLEGMIHSLAQPIAEVMRSAGLEWVKRCHPDAWRRGFAEIIENVLHAEPEPRSRDVEIEVMTCPTVAVVGTRTAFLSLRLHHRGDLPLIPTGPGSSTLWTALDHVGAKRIETPLPGLLLPGQSQAAAVVVNVPDRPGDFWLETGVGDQSIRMPFAVRPRGSHADRPAEISELLAEIQSLHRLPDDYVDVTLGWFAGFKKWLKRKCLGNFKHAYVDVLSRQQTRVNQKLLAVLQQVVEENARLKHAIETLREDLAQSRDDAEEADRIAALRVGDPCRTYNGHL